MRLGRIRRWSTVGAIGVVLLVAGCSGSSSSTGRASPTQGQKVATSLVALFRQAQQRPGLSDFEREVLNRAVSSGRIAQADYEEAHSRYARCMKDAGVTETYTKLPNGAYEIHPPLADGHGTEATAALDRYKTVSDKCARGTMPVVESLFLVQQGNPDLLADPYAVAVRCLVKVGAVSAAYTAEALKKDLQGDAAKASFKIGDPQAHTCLWSAGFAVNAAS
jgi:hypothetical protein